MKHFLIAILALFAISSAHSQVQPVKWHVETQKLSDTQYNLIYKADIDAHWHLYSQFLPEGGAIPTEFFYKEDQLGKDFKLVGKAIESDNITKYDPVFEMDLTYFDTQAVFTQKIELLNPDLNTIEAEISYQACDDERCIFDSEVATFNLTDAGGSQENQASNVFEPVTWTSKAKQLSDDEYLITYTAKIDAHWHLYSQNIKGDEGPIATEFTFNEQADNYELLGKTTEPDVQSVYDDVFGMDIKYFENQAQFTQKIKVTNPELKSIPSEVFFMVCDDEKCLPPSSHLFNTPLNGAAESQVVANIDDHSKQLSDKLNLNVKGWDKFEKEEVKEKSNFTIFILGFLGGLIALLTPCVFPMIPLTVSFFTKSSGKASKGVRDSVLYGLFIFFIYVLLSLPFHLLDSLDPEILNNISTNVPLNILFFVIFIVFAISFFGYFELTLPQSWSRAMDEKANKIGGWIGIFFMALTLAIVSFSCTGPILGTLLGSSLSSDGGAMQLTMGMSGFGLALALPFTMFAMFPKWLNSLPKSGGWLNTVKVVLGFIELALALKFLSNADLVEHWGLLKREVFIGLWIIIGCGLFLYLIGKIKFPHDGPLKQINFSRGAFAFLVLAFVVYLLPGLQKEPAWNLKLLSGFPPPMSYSLYHKAEKLTIFKDLNEGLAYAEKNNKPVMLDFTGWACVNCRKMEEHVWTDPRVEDLLKNEYVIISLYVDDRDELPKAEQFNFLKPSGSVKKIKTIGDKYATMQTINFKNNSQPFYVLMTHEMNLLNGTKAYTDATDYYNWLKEGLKNYK